MHEKSSTLISFLQAFAIIVVIVSFAACAERPEETEEQQADTAQSASATDTSGIDSTQAFFDPADIGYLFEPKKHIELRVVCAPDKQSYYYIPSDTLFVRSQEALHVSSYGSRAYIVLDSAARYIERIHSPNLRQGIHDFTSTGRRLRPYLFLSISARKAIQYDFIPTDCQGVTALAPPVMIIDP